MPRASQPHSPESDLAARRAYVAVESAPHVLAPDLAEFCQSGISVIVGACVAGETPVAATGYACRLMPGNRFRLVLRKLGNEGLLEAVERGGAIAATFSQPTTHRSIQIKGSGAVVLPADEEDRREALRQTDGLRLELIYIGYPPAFAAAYRHVAEDDLVAVDLTPDAAFVQTPGPGAGAELKP
ncbi:MAG: hypothetical protein JJ913_04985 [Rhizobiaceae bacterium]|nr:hypothetical protein [Rhizobiaceae bacterium]